MPLMRKVWSSNPRPTKRFSTASTSTQVAVLPWHYVVEMGTGNSFALGYNERLKGLNLL